tara:strand:- start:374 stop:1105 length:732 start_codon:yes stop_codon:yes gene_type:complete
MGCDVFFLSYNEDFADYHYELLLHKAPLAKRVHGVKGIFKAHKECAKKSDTDFFYVVDADAILEDSFYFNYVPSDQEEWWPNVKQTDCVHVWRCMNPVNNLIYGYGGVKLFPKKDIISARNWNIDFTSSTAQVFKAMPEVSNITAFNTDPFNAWKSAFRECTKLSAEVIKYRDNKSKVESKTSERLNIWCTVGDTEPFGEWAIKGANLGKQFGLKHKGSKTALNLINDFDWLKDQFLDIYGNV